LYEELLADDEHTLSTPHQKLRIALARSVDPVWVKNLLKWIESIHDADEPVIKAGLKTWVQEYEVDLSDKKPANFTPQTTTIH